MIAGAGAGEGGESRPGAAAGASLGVKSHVCNPENESRAVAGTTSSALFFSFVAVRLFILFSE